MLVLLNNIRVYVQIFTATQNQLQSNFSGSNTVGTMKMCSSQGKLELTSVNHSARSGGIIGIFFDFL